MPTARSLSPKAGTKNSTFTEQKRRKAPDGFIRQFHVNEKFSVHIEVCHFARMVLAPQNSATKRWPWEEIIAVKNVIFRFQAMA